MRARVLPCVLLALLLGSGTAWAPGRPVLGSDDFTRYLSPYGQWVSVDPYGLCWKPYNMPKGWRPYTNGRWVYTDYGWTWVSNLPWGWAPFHYGRWTNQGPFGWIWIPGSTWGPGWCAWRYGNGWAGWTPLPPGVVWAGRDFAGNFRWDGIVTIEAWIFAPEKDLLAPDLSKAVVPGERNKAIFPETKSATRYDLIEGRIFDRSLDPEKVAKAAGQAVPRYDVNDCATVDDYQTEKRFSKREVYMYRPVMPWMKQ